MAQARPRFDVVLHQRLLRHVRSPRLVQELCVPVEVVSAMDGYFDEFQDEIGCMKDVGGDIKVVWEAARPCYKNLGVVGYPGTFRLGRHVNPTSNGVARIMSWRSEFRDSVLAYGYDQYDIAHALPTIIHHYFKDLNLPNLAAAIHEIDNPTIQRQAVKSVVTRVLQGCPINNTPDNMDVMQCEWFDGLQQEAVKIHAAMEERYPGFVSLCKAKRQKDHKPVKGWPSTAIQIFYDDVESMIQVESAARLDGGSQILINCDALFVPKTLSGNTLEILNGLHGRMGIRYVRKPMIQRVVIPDIDMIIQRVHGGADESAAVGTYEAWKRGFEKDNFFLKSGNKYVTINHRTKELYYTSYFDFINSRYAFDKDRVKDWTEDASRRTYDRIVNTPPPNACNPSDFNLWDFNSSFRAAGLPALGPDDDLDVLVEPVLEMFRCIVSGNEDHFNYLINYMADSLQNPGIKRAQYIGMYGEQGVGKNELMERFWMDKIIGPELTATYKSIAEWAGPYEDGWQNKMWVMVHEAEYKDFSSYYQFLKGVTGSLLQKSNTKYGAHMKIAFYGRIIMLSNYANAFNEDNMISRRQGLRCIASPFRSVPNALEILKREKVQRAFYDYLMDVDLDGWDPEGCRVDSDRLRDANFMTSFRKEQGNMMMILMHLSIDKLYEMFRRVDDDADPPEYSRKFAFPQSMIYDAYFDLCNFDADEKRTKNAHVINMAALATQLDPGNRLHLIEQKQMRAPFFKGASQMNRPSFVVDYYALKNALVERMERFHVAEYVDLQTEQQRILAKLEAYHKEQIDAGWDYRPSIVQFMAVPKTRSAHRNGPGQEPRYVVRQGGEVVFMSDDLEEINRELGEAWIEQTQDGELLHVNNREIVLGDRYMRPHGKTMLELRFPFYIRDRTA